MRERLKKIVEHDVFQNTVIILILLNALTMGLDTFAFWQKWMGSAAMIIDQVFVWFFLLEIILKLIVYRFSFFKSGWNIFDFLIVGISLIPGNTAFSCFRAIRTLRIFRTARLFGRIKSLRLIVEAMLHALPKLWWLFVVLMLIFYIFAVFSTILFRECAPNQFGSIFKAFYTLFSLMTMEGWQDTVDAVNSPYARWVFIPFILISSYIFLNLVVGIVVASVENIVWEEKEEMQNNANDRMDKLQAEIRQLSEQLKEIKALLAGENDRKN